MSMLPVEPAYRLAEHADEHRWLVTGLWSEQAVGIVGGEPKCCKSFLALDLAVSVASGAPCSETPALTMPSTSTAASKPGPARSTDRCSAIDSLHPKRIFATHAAD